MAKFSENAKDKKENVEVLKKGGVMGKKSLAKKAVKEKWIIFKDSPQAFPTSHNSIDMYKQPRTKKEFLSELLQVCWTLQEAGDFQDGGWIQGVHLEDQGASWRIQDEDHPGEDQAGEALWTFILAKALCYIV